MDVQTVQNGLSAVFPVAFSLFAIAVAVWCAVRSVPWYLQRALAALETRVSEAEASWTRFHGDLVVQLEQLEQLDASVVKNRQKVTAENRRRGSSVEIPDAPTSIEDLRRRAYGPPR